MTTTDNSYGLTRWIYMRSLGIIYLVAFFSFYLQFRGLIGHNGIFPFKLYLDSASSNLGAYSYLLVPAVNWLNISDVFMQWQLLTSIVLSVFLTLGIFPFGTSILLWVSYLSVVNVGQIFMSYQWDVLLLEAGFLSLFIASFKLFSKPANSRSPSAIILFLFRFLLFKLMFSSGIGKLLSGDETWRNLTALDFHYFTQPLPNPVSWYMFQLPQWFQKLSVFITLAIEIVVPFFYFFPGKARWIAGYITIAFQLILMATGNYTFFNLLTIILCVFLYDDKFFSSLLSIRISTEQKYKFPGTGGHSVNIKRAGIIFIAFVILFMNIMQFGRRYFGIRNVPESLSKISLYLSGFHIVNNYGLFTVMTTRRSEIIIQGSNDGIVWHDYEFRYKPGDPVKPLRFVAPFQPRLDWQMWFAALGNYRMNPWVINLLYRLKSGSPEVIKLFEGNPFPNAPPSYLRAVMYDYKFTTTAERKKTGAVWKRQYLGTYLPGIIK